MRKGCLFLIALMLFFVGAGAVLAAEVRNVVAVQAGNRVQFTYDLVGDVQEAEVTVNLTIPGQEHKAAKLHLEGDVGKVKPGRGRVIWWNVLKDFPRGLNAEIAWEITAGRQTFTDLATSMEFVFVQGGCFQMGDTFGDGVTDEKPVHNVCVNDFYMGKYEVTQGQWQSVMGSNPSHFKNCGANCPVESVSWNDVQDFISRLNGKTGKSYRLPTEAEWEYAARSGGKKEKYAGTSSDNELVDYAWYHANSGRSTRPVGGKNQNDLGLYDLSGNVWEWCQDWYEEKYYSISPRDNPRGPSSGDRRVLRGGSWVPSPSSSARRADSGTSRRSGTSLSGFVCPGPPHDYFLSSDFLFSDGGVKGRTPLSAVIFRYHLADGLNESIFPGFSLETCCNCKDSVLSGGVFWVRVTLIFTLPVIASDDDSRRRTIK